MLLGAFASAMADLLVKKRSAYTLLNAAMLLLAPSALARMSWLLLVLCLYGSSSVWSYMRFPEVEWNPRLSEVYFIECLIGEKARYFYFGLICCSFLEETYLAC